MKGQLLQQEKQNGRSNLAPVDVYLLCRICYVEFKNERKQTSRNIVLYNKTKPQDEIKKTLGICYFNHIYTYIIICSGMIACACCNDNV